MLGISFSDIVAALSGRQILLAVAATLSQSVNRGILNVTYTLLNFFSTSTALQLK